MNTQSRIKQTSDEILTLIISKKIPLHEAMAALKKAKKKLRGKEYAVKGEYETR